MSDQDNPAAPRATAPDWDHHEDDVFCPLCEYNLRGLIEPRCPECGYRFEWPDLLNPSRRLHPYLFEHHPEKNFRSFWRTAIGGLRPRRFWASLHPVQPSCPRRLILYWCLAASVVIIACVALVIAVVLAVARVNAASHPQFIARWNLPQNAAHRAELVRQYGSIEALAEKIAPARFFNAAGDAIRFSRVPRALVLPLLVGLAWPWLTFLALLVFRGSMRRARIGPTRVLRCVLYSSDVLLWYGLLLLAVAPWEYYAEMNNLVSSGMLRQVELAVGATFTWIVTFRLFGACRYYLRLSHTAWTVTVSQFIVALLVSNVVLAYIAWL
jgi:hypothetical protein